MKKDNFFQQLKKNLEKQEAPAYHTEDWSDMQARLDLQEKPDAAFFTNRKIIMAATGILLLGLLVSNLFLFQEVKDAKQKIQYLENQISQDLSEVSETSALSETSSISSSITSEETRSTIFNSTDDSETREKVIQSISDIPADKNNFIINNATAKTFGRTDRLTKNRENELNVKQLLYNKDKEKGIILDNRISNDFSHEPISSTKKREQIQVTNPATGSLTTQQPSSSDYYKKGENNLSFPTLPTLSLLPLKNGNDLLNIPIVILEQSQQKKKNSTNFFHLKPKGFELGFSMGTSFTNAADLDQFDAINFNLIANIKFSEAVSLWLSAGQINYNFSSTIIGDQNSIPEIDAPSEDFTFLSADVRRKARIVDAGLQYTFRDKKKWQPHLGVGLGTASLLLDEVTYNFREPDNGGTTQGGTSVGGGNTGNSSQIPNLFGVKGGILYRF